jgi:hypothetical protein
MMNMFHGESACANGCLRMVGRGRCVSGHLHGEDWCNKFNTSSANRVTDKDAEVSS